MFTLKLKWLKQYRSYMMNCQKIPLFGGIILMCIYILILGLYVCISYLIYGMLLWFLGHFLEILFCSQHSKVQARYNLHFVDENMEVEGFSYQPTIFNQGWFFSPKGYFAIARNIFGYHSCGNATGQPLKEFSGPNVNIAELE